MNKKEIEQEYKIRIKLIGVLKGLAKTGEVEIKASEEGKSLKEIVLELSKLFGEDFKTRILQGEKISPDVLVNYNGKVFPIRNNENLIIESGSTITIFSFVHGG